MEKMVQKSVRIPADIVEFVNNQSGADFSKKLVAILTEYKDEELERKLMIQRYDELIAERKNYLDVLMSNVRVVKRVEQRVLDLVNEVDRAELSSKYSSMEA